MGKRVDARDVLDPNAKTVRGFSAQVVGYFRRVGPNSWDDYEFVAKEGEQLEVYPKIRIQLEEFGVDFRMRHEGRVARLRWLPTDSDQAHIRNASPSQQRAFFAEHYLDSFAHKAGAGASAVIASKLRS